MEIGWLCWSLGIKDTQSLLSIWLWCLLVKTSSSIDRIWTTWPSSRMWRSTIPPHSNPWRCILSLLRLKLLITVTLGQITENWVTWSSSRRWGHTVTQDFNPSQYIWNHQRFILLKTFIHLYVLSPIMVSLSHCIEAYSGHCLWADLFHPWLQSCSLRHKPTCFLDSGTNNLWLP